VPTPMPGEFRSIRFEMLHRFPILCQLLAQFTTRLCLAVRATEAGSRISLRSRTST